MPAVVSVVAPLSSMPVPPPSVRSLAPFTTLPLMSSVRLAVADWAARSLSKLTAPLRVRLPSVAAVVAPLSRTFVPPSVRSLVPLTTLPLMSRVAPAVASWAPAPVKSTSPFNTMSASVNRSAPIWIVPSIASVVSRSAVTSSVLSVSVGSITTLTPARRSRSDPLTLPAVPMVTEPSCDWIVYCMPSTRPPNASASGMSASMIVASCRQVKEVGDVDGPPEPSKDGRLVTRSTDAPVAPPAPSPASSVMSSDRKTTPSSVNETSPVPSVPECSDRDEEPVMSLLTSMLPLATTETSSAMSVPAWRTLPAAPEAVISTVPPAALIWPPAALAMSPSTATSCTVPPAALMIPLLTTPSARLNGSPAPRNTWPLPALTTPSLTTPVAAPGSVVYGLIVTLTRPVTPSGMTVTESPETMINAALLPRRLIVPLLVTSRPSSCTTLPLIDAPAWLVTSLVRTNVLLPILKSASSMVPPTAKSPPMPMFTTAPASKTMPLGLTRYTCPPLEISCPEINDIPPAPSTWLSTRSFADIEPMSPLKNVRLSLAAMLKLAKWSMQLVKPGWRWT